MRRAFIFAAGLAAWPIVALAQQTAPPGPKVRIRGDRGVEHSAHSKTGLLPASGTGTEADLLEASSLCACVKREMDERQYSEFTRLSFKTSTSAFGVKRTLRSNATMSRDFIKFPLWYEYDSRWSALLRSGARTLACACKDLPRVTASKTMTPVKRSSVALANSFIWSI